MEICPDGTNRVHKQWKSDQMAQTDYTIQWRSDQMAQTEYKNNGDLTRWHKQSTQTMEI
jgi:hypothetical protein